VAVQKNTTTMTSLVALSLSIVLLLLLAEGTYGFGGVSTKRPQQGTLSRQSSLVKNSWISTSSSNTGSNLLLLQLANRGDNDKQTLSQLGFDEDSTSKDDGSGVNTKVEDGVRVDLMGDVDPLTLTAVGFGLIAFNFFIFANMGDAGLSGVIARIINTINN
jgi:hypothetical protein